MTAAVRISCRPWRTTRLSPLLTPNDAASSGESWTALPKTSLLNGSGHSCSQALFAYRPSQTDGEGDSRIENPAASRVDGMGGIIGVAEIGVPAELGTTPSVSVSAHHLSASAPAASVQLARTISRADIARPPSSRLRNSGAGRVS